MSNPLIERPWFMDLVKELRNSRREMEKAINRFTMRRLAEMEVSDILEISLSGGNYGIFCRGVADYLTFRLSLCGLIEERDAAKYLWPKNGNPFLVEKIMESINLAYQSQEDR